MQIEQAVRENSISIIGKDLKLKGDFKFANEVHVYGEIEGTIQFAAEGKLVIEQSGKIFGKLMCDQVEIYGMVDGSIESTSSVIVRSSGKIKGTIHAKNLSVYPGALLNIEGHTKEA